MSLGADVWVGMMGSKLDAKTMEATGFHRAMLVSSWFNRITLRFSVMGTVVLGSVYVVSCLTMLKYLSMTLSL